MYRNHIITGSSIIVNLTDDTISIHNTNPLYRDVLEAIREGDYESIPDKANIASKIRKDPSGLFNVVDGQIYMDRELMPEVLSKRILMLVDRGICFQSLIKFWQKLKLNPSKRSVECLYGFMEHNHVTMTESGDILLYKRVTEDFHDVYTKSIDNSIGRTIQMPRAMVDDDPHHPCSYGYHCSNWNYADNFYTNGILIEVLVNPGDVVAVPYDYDNSKMRVCGYKVLRECGGPREELVYDCDEEDDFLFDDQENFSF